jgi:uncharacterized protein (DUF1501 family)
VRPPASDPRDPRLAALTRRRFLQLGTAGVVTVTFAGCGGPDGEPASAPGTTTSKPFMGSLPAATTTTEPATGPAPTTAAPTGAGTDRVLVVVQLNGGNDGLNTLVPADGRYHDARPTLAIPESDVLTLSGATGYGWNPALAPLLPLWDAARMACVAGIGFPDPDRSHFVAMDRWWRADDLSAPAGWLGRVLDGLAAEPTPLHAVALGAGAPLLDGEQRRPTVILTPDGFVFDERLDTAALGLLATSGADAGELEAAARAATARAIGAVEAFARVAADTAGSDGDVGTREGGASLAQGLDLAGRLVTSDAGTRIVVVSAGGFDTHAGQADQHAALLADLAAGIVGFQAQVEAAGIADRVLLVTTSEFGRRVAENASGGTDHGAGSSVLVVGPVRPGIHGGVDLGDLLDGDVRPSVDARALHTTCLDWLGVEPEPVLGGRWDDVALLA